MRFHHRIFVHILLLLTLQSCEKGGSAKPASAPSSELNAEQKLPTHVMSQESASIFKFETLPNSLGNALSEEIMRRIEKDCSSLPLMQDVLSPGAHPYLLDLDGEIKVTLWIASNRLICLVYALGMPSSQGAETERQLLERFRFSNEESLNIADKNAQSVSMPVKAYIHKTREELQALTYTRGTIRTLAFYDSSILDGKKFLPRSSSTKMSEEELRRVRKTIDENFEKFGDPFKDMK